MTEEDSDLDPDGIGAQGGVRHPDPVLRRWLSAWVGIGVVIVAVTAVFLVLIGNSLSRVNSDLAATDAAVTDVSGSTRTLPDQIERVNRSLAVIEAALRVLPEDSEQIATNLSEILQALEVVRGDLATTAPKLAGTAGNLAPSADLVASIGADLADTSTLLTRILNGTGSIHESLMAIGGKGSRGLAGVHANLSAVNDVLRAIRGELGDITATGGRVNGQLERICRSPAIALRNGPQPC